MYKKELDILEQMLESTIAGYWDWDIPKKCGVHESHI